MTWKGILEHISYMLAGDICDDVDHPESPLLKRMANCGQVNRAQSRQGELDSEIMIILRRNQTRRGSREAQ